VDLQRKALQKLEQIDVVDDLNELRVPPGNKLEKLSGDRAGQYSIRINRQYRMCFVWEDGDAYDVEIVDYH
jgi:toxin HigB-1